MECLPQDIVLNILSRLPMTSFLQLKHVCRAWRALAENPILIDMHFSRGAKDDPCFIVLCGNQIYCVELSAQHEGNAIVTRFRKPELLSNFDVVGSSNGLLCLCDSIKKSQLCICNPFIRNYVELPRTAPYVQQGIVFGFGFLTTTKAYKVVKIACNWGARSPVCHLFRSNLQVQSDVEILTVGSSKWKSLGTIPYRFIWSTLNVLVSGRLHWITWPSRRQPGQKIISFDLTNERFQEVQKPSFNSLYNCGFDLVDLRGCLATFVYCNNETFDVWVMKDYGVAESWHKAYNITYWPKGLEQIVDQPYMALASSMGRHTFRVVCLQKNGELLLEYGCRSLISYNPKSGAFNLKYGKLPSWSGITTHVGSLKWIDNLNST